MIAGIGIDTVSIDRFERLIAVRGERFLKRIFSEEEINEGMRLANRAPFFAGRFAAREALVKALGTGFMEGVGLRDISVEKGERGKPELRFSRALQEIMEQRGVARCHLSITHDGDIAQALVILEINSETRAKPKGDDR